MTCRLLFWLNSQLVNMSSHAVWLKVLQCGIFFSCFLVEAPAHSLIRTVQTLRFIKLSNLFLSFCLLSSSFTPSVWWTETNRSLDIDSISHWHPRPPITAILHYGTSRVRDWIFYLFIIHFGCTGKFSFTCMNIAFIISFGICLFISISNFRIL